MEPTNRWVWESKVNYLEVVLLTNFRIVIHSPLRRPLSGGSQVIVGQSDVLHLCELSLSLVHNILQGLASLFAAGATFGHGP